MENITGVIWWKQMTGLSDSSPLWHGYLSESQTWPTIALTITREMVKNAPRIRGNYFGCKTAGVSRPCWIELDPYCCSGEDYY